MPQDTAARPARRKQSKAKQNATEAGQQTNKQAHTGSSKRTSKPTSARTDASLGSVTLTVGHESGYPTCHDRPGVGAEDSDGSFGREGLPGTAGTAGYSRHLGEQTCGGKAEGSETENCATLLHCGISACVGTSANMRCSLRNACSFVAASIHSAVARECSNAARTWPHALLLCPISVSVSVEGCSMHFYGRRLFKRTVGHQDTAAGDGGR